MPSVREVKEYVFGRPVSEYPRHGTPTLPGPKYMDKLSYAKWLENTVRPQWPIGVLCTFHRIEEQEHRVPVPLFRLVDLQEIHMLAPIAEYVNEPRCLVVECSSFKGSSQTCYPPGLLRKLTVREIELVHLRDQQRKDDQGSLDAANEDFAG